MTIKFMLAAALALLAAPAHAKETAADNYRAYCVQCHGTQGTGQGVNARDLSVVPRDHTDAKGMSGRSDELLFKAIKEGGMSISKSVLMPPWAGTLTDEEIKDLVQYLRVLCKCQFGS